MSGAAKVRLVLILPDPQARPVRTHRVTSGSESSRSNPSPYHRKCQESASVDRNLTSVDSVEKSLAFGRDEEKEKELEFPKVDNDVAMNRCCFEKTRVFRVGRVYRRMDTVLEASYLSRSAQIVT